MNTQRLHSLLRVLVNFNDKYNFANLLQRLEATYTQSVQAPSPENATAFENAREAIRAATHDFPKGSLTPSRRKMLETIGGTVYYGDNLLNRIQEIITNSDTPSNTVSDIQALRLQAKKFFPALKALNDNLDKLEIGVEDPPSEAAEIEILFPEAMFDGQLRSLVKEARSLENAISDIREVVTGKREPIEIRTLDSGSMDFFLIVDLPTGVQILGFVTAIVLLINSIMQTRINRQSLEQQKLPGKITKDIKSWEEKRIQEKIDELRDELTLKYKGNVGRKNELNNALSKSLKYLANRIDRGMDIDVTTASPVEDTGEEQTEESIKKLKSIRPYIDTIQDNSNTILQVQRNREPVLQLPLSDEEESKNKKGGGKRHAM